MGFSGNLIQPFSYFLHGPRHLCSSDLWASFCNSLPLGGKIAAAAHNTNQGKHHLLKILSQKMLLLQKSSANLPSYLTEHTCSFLSHSLWLNAMC